MSEWQEIETAPKGRAVLIYYTNSLGRNRIIKAVYVERYTEEASPDSDYFEWGEGDKEEFTCTPAGWFEQIDNLDDIYAVEVDSNPSHWMPLPEPPK